MQYSVFGGVAAAALFSVAHGLPPIEAYGELPEISSVAIAPDGKHYAYLTRKGSESFFAVADADGKLVGGARAGDLTAEYVWFATNDHVVMVSSEEARLAGFRGEWEHSGAVSYHIGTKKMVVLMKGTDGLFPAQSGLGSVIGRLGNTNTVFMPAFMGSASSDPTYDLLKVNLDTGRGVTAAKGDQTTIDWYVDDDGVVLAREDWNDKGKYYRVLTKKDGKLEAVFSESKIDTPSFVVLGVAADKSSLYVGSKPDDSEFYSIRKMSFDGSVSAPVFAAPDKDVESVITDGNRIAIGVRYSGMQPSYEFSDPAMTKAIDDVASLYPGSAVYLRDWTADFSKLIFYIAGGDRAPGFYLFDRAAQKISRIATSYPKIADADIGPTATIEYKARDGRKIPSVITRPPGTELGQTLPLIVMPHGGPEAYDAVGFDWMAQYFASRGFLVLQPNFRGSDGFGDAHRKAGHGEWGGKMQDDITDGVKLLVKYKWADPNRICIIGGSYGGYAALAGGAYTPDLYKCVAAIAPVADLASMLATERREHGRKSSIYSYWTKLIGDRSKDRARIDAVSPVNAAANFKAPVLLIHGSDDDIVPYSQSTKMEAALKEAGKSVRLVKLKGEDHFLSSSEMRLLALKELDAFVAASIGAR
jgi:acetyl esterase/lipase